MPNPKHRTSKQRKHKRRTHLKAETATLHACSNCGTSVQYHHVCPECGHYRGKLVIEKEVTA